MKFWRNEEEISAEEGAQEEVGQALKATSEERTGFDVLATLHFNVLSGVLVVAAVQLRQRPEFSVPMSDEAV